MLHGASADPVQAPPGHRLGLRQGAGRIIAPDDRRQVHGEITAASQGVGKGSTFRVLVPLAWRGRSTTRISVPSGPA